jgi:predicted nucleic acid-binding protein
VQPEGIAISGLARSGMARSSTGVMYKQHLGASRKGFDAIIAHSAHSMGATLVSEDRRCRERLKRLASSGSAMTYVEFKTWLDQTIAGQS